MASTKPRILYVEKDANKEIGMMFETLLNLPVEQFRNIEALKEINPFQYSLFMLEPFNPGYLDEKRSLSNPVVEYMKTLRQNSRPVFMLTTISEEKLYARYEFVRGIHYNYYLQKGSRQNFDEIKKSLLELAICGFSNQIR